MSQQHTPPAIRVADVRQALWAAKFRKSTGGRTALLAATSTAPVLAVDCSSSQGLRAAAAKTAAVVARVNCAPMQRGHLGGLIARTQLWHGPREVRATWGAPAKTLLAESRYVLNGGVAA